MTDPQMEEIFREQALLRPPTQMVRRIQAAVSSDLRPVRPLAPAPVYAACFAAVFVGLCVLSCYLMPNLAGWQALGAVRRWFVFLPLGLMAALLLVSTVQQLAPAAKYKRQILEGSGGAMIVLLGAIAQLFHPVTEAAFFQNALACFRIGITFSIPAGLVFFVFLRRGARLSPGLAGAAAGALAGLTGTTVLELHCPNFDVYHILVAHVSVPVLCAIAGFIVSSIPGWLGHGDLLQTTDAG